MATGVSKSKVLARILLSGIATCLLGLAVLRVTQGIDAIATAEEQKQTEKTAKEGELDPDYAVPDGSAKEIFEFVDELQAKRPKFANRQELIDHAIKVQKSFIAAGDKVLKLMPDEELVEKAAGLKLNALIMLAANDIEDYPKIALDSVTAMKADKNETISKAAASKWNVVRIFNVGTLSESERGELAEEVLANAEKKKFVRDVMGEVLTLGRQIEQKASTKEAVAYYNRVAEKVESHGSPQLEELASRMKATARRVGLPGNTMQIDGKKLDGSPFDWESYRGKVVLVDFWATWCGPCIAELPNVKENYTKYHDKGFDVVGISLDRSREPLEKFIEKEELPWTQMYDEEIQKGKGWNHPVAEHYGISAIPAVILVDKEGKVVSLNARGPELGKLLEKLLGKAE